MAPPLRDRIEQMALMAMMDGILHTTVPCNCPTCKSEGGYKGTTRPQLPKRTTSEHSDGVKLASMKPEAAGTCTHNHSLPDSKPVQAPRRSTPQSKSSSASSTNPGRSDKVNALLKADNVQAVFDVLNLTNTSKEEKDLATQIQNVTKDCKLYQETKEHILKLCHEEHIDANAVYGLLAKFRYERNMLTTAVIKGNNEREKSLLCIQRVDHLMYMLQDVAKKKDSKGTDVMHKLGDIIMEIHDLAKTPSTLYDEFLDIKEEHLDLLNDHEEMHQKFVDVNSCHEKLHSSHDKLQTDHTKLLRDHAEAKKRASAVGGFKNDITRLEKSVDKTQVENSQLKKEVEKLSAELAKVNALKHENAQLKKKVATLTSTPPVEEPQHDLHGQAGKKKKGKKGTSEALVAKSVTPEPVPDFEARLLESRREHEAQITRLKKAHDTATHELDLVRANLKQLDVLLRKAENARDKAVEKLEVEKATSSNWKDIAKGHSAERDRLKSEMDRHVSRAGRLQSTVGELEHNLASTKIEVVEQGEAIEVLRRAKEELENRSPTPAMSIASYQPTALAPDTVRLLRKIRGETTQLVRDLDDSTTISGEFINPLDLIHHSVHRTVSEIERDIEEILSVKGNDLPINIHNHMPEAVMPFTYNNTQQRETPHYYNRSDHSPQDSPHIPPSASLPPFRPMMPPPGLGDPTSTSPFSHNSNHTHTHMRAHDSPSAPFSRIVEPPGLTANLGFNRTIDPPLTSASRYATLPSSSPAHPHLSIPITNSLPNPNVGVIGSRSTSSKLNATPSPNSTPAPSTASAPGASVTNGIHASSATGSSGLGNGAVGVDWNMWARSGR